jgi:hypothetical protein
VEERLIRGAGRELARARSGSGPGSSGLENDGQNESENVVINVDRCISSLRRMHLERTQGTFQFMDRATGLARAARTVAVLFRLATDARVRGSFPSLERTRGIA